MLIPVSPQTIQKIWGGGIIPDGKKTDNEPITLYALSTCIWCRKTKQLLTKLGVKYLIIDVDLLEGSARDRAEDEVRKYNPSVTFPTLVIGSGRCITGFNEDEIRRAFSR